MGERICHCSGGCPRLPSAYPDQHVGHVMALAEWVWLFLSHHFLLANHVPLKARMQSWNAWLALTP